MFWIFERLIDKLLKINPKVFFQEFFIPKGFLKGAPKGVFHRLRGIP